VGPHVTRALEQVVTRYGAMVIASIEAAVEALRVSCGEG
jgi:hypothetical protein